MFAEQMNRHSNGCFISILIITGLAALAFWCFLQIDFIGTKDPNVVRIRHSWWDHRLLSAEYRKGINYCEVDILDSANIRIAAGGDKGETIEWLNYTRSGDTIIITEDLKFVDKYLNSSRMLIRGERILYLKNEDGDFDTTRSLRVRFNDLSPSGN